MAWSITKLRPFADGLLKAHIAPMEAERVARTFYVKAKWDDEAKVFYSETNVPGLNIEADTLKEFLDLAEDLAPQLLKANRPDGEATVTMSGLELAIAC